MAGLLDSATAQAPDEPETAATADAEGIDDGEQPNVTPEEQAQYEKFVRNGLEVIYDGDKVRDEMLNRLRESSDPIENLANTTVYLTMNLENSAEHGGNVQLDDAVVMHGGIALLEELATVAQAADIHDFTDDEMQGATYRALDLYREAKTESGDIDPEALKEQFGEIKNAGQSGTITDLLPQLADQMPASDAAPAPAAPAAPAPPAMPA